MQASLTVARTKVGLEEIAVVAMADDVAHERGGVDLLKEKIEAALGFPVVLIGHAGRQVIGSSAVALEADKLVALKWKSERIDLA